jgi:small subunit ribosomal protein S14
VKKSANLLIVKHKAKRELLKTKLQTVDSFQERLALYKRFEKIPRNAAPSRHRNRCWVTGRSRGFYKDFGLSRHVLREMAHDGLIPGLTKSSW